MNPLHFLKKEIFKDLSFLLGGTFIAQLIPILLQPLLKRLFTVEEFGVFDLYFRSVGLLAILFSLRYEKAIVLCKKRSDSATLYIGIIILGFGLFMVTELLLVILNSFEVDFLSIPKKYSLVIYLIPLSALFFSINTASQFMFIRQKRFMASSSLKIFRRGSEGLVQTVSGLSGSFWGLPLGESIGNFSAAAVGFFRLKKELQNELPKDLIPNIKRVAHSYSEFPKYALGSNLLNTFVLSALTFQIFAKFSIVEVGYAELTQRMLTIPTALIGVSLGQIILQRFSGAFNDRSSIIKLFISLFTFSVSIAIPFFITIYFWGPEIFGWIFGEEWRTSGMYAKSLILSTSIFFVISPYGQILIAIQKVKLNSIWEVIKFLLIGSLFFFKFQSIESYLKYYNAIVIVVYFMYLIVILLSVINYQNKLGDETNH